LAQLRFRRQCPIGPYILDFYCSAARLAIEVDGFAHDTAVQTEHDEHRKTWLLAQGITILRVRATDVLRDEMLEDILLAIEQAVAPFGAQSAPPPPHRGGGS
jgi:very-short-patch-repair endonuclease